MRVIKYCLVLAITGIFILSCTASKNTFGKKYEILDIDSLGSKSMLLQSEILIFQSLKKAN